MALHPQARAFLAGMEGSGAPPLHELTPEEARAATGVITELIGAGPPVAEPDRRGQRGRGAGVGGEIRTLVATLNAPA